MFEDFGCKVGDTLFIALIDKKKVCKFDINCLKVFSTNYTAHGYIYGKNGKWGQPTEFDLTKLNKRVVFTEKTNAEKWLDKQLNKGENSTI